MEYIMLANIDISSIIGLIAWVKAHLAQVWEIFSSIVTVASLIAALTPTQKDDAFLAKIMPWVAKIALNTKKHV